LAGDRPVIENLKALSQGLRSQGSKIGNPLVIQHGDALNREIGSNLLGVSASEK
jgi:hypothetical protein